MNYISSQSYHTLTHWQSNRASSKIRYVEPYILAGSYYDDIMHLQNIYAASSFNTGGLDLSKIDVNTGGWWSRISCFREIPTVPNNIVYIEKCVYKNVNYYVVLSDLESDVGLVAPSNIVETSGDVTVYGKNNTVDSRGKIIGIDDSTGQNIGAVSVGDPIGLRLSLYSLFVVVGDELPDWFDISKIDRTVEISDVGYTSDPFGFGQNCEYITPIAVNSTGDVLYKSGLCDWFKPVRVREDAYSRVETGLTTNSIVFDYFDVGGMVLMDGKYYCCMGHTYTPDDEYSAYRSGFCFGIYNGFDIGRQYYLGLVSNNVWSTYLPRWSV